MSAISRAQALGLYSAFLQQRISATAPALRNNPSEVTADPATGQYRYFSLLQLLNEVQRGTPIGVNEAVKYAAAKGYRVV